MSTPAQSAPGEFHTYDLDHLKRLNLQDAAQRRRAWDELHVVSALQGLANRDAPQLYVFWTGAGGATDRFWMRKMQTADEWLSASKAVPISGLDELVRKFRASYKGIVVWDERVAATSNLASTIAGVESLLPVRYDPSADSLYSRLTGQLAIPVKRRLIREDGSAMFTGHGTISETTTASTGSAKCDAYIWAAKQYLESGRSNAARMGYYPDAYWLHSKNPVGVTDTLLSNHDYFISQRAFFFDLAAWSDEAPDDDRPQPLGADYEALLTVMHAAYKANGPDKMIHVGGFTPWDQKYTSHTGQKHDGVPTEWHLVQVLSCFNAYIDADAPGYHAMANASFYQHYPLRERYPQPNLPTMESLRGRGYVGADGRVTSRTFVAIYVGDYDSTAWLYRQMPELWEDPDRGSVPLSWAFNPNLADRFPFGLAYARKSATVNDSFVAGDSGAGYLNPGYLEPPRKFSGLPSGADAWERHCSSYYKKWDLSVTGFVIEGYARQMSNDMLARYARFSPGGAVVWRDEGKPGNVDGMPYLKMSYDLTRTPEEGARVIATKAPKAAGFAVFRTILWSPSQHRQLFEATRKLRPDIEMVDLNTLMALRKVHDSTSH